MNAFPKDVVVAWNESIEKFDSDNIVARQSDVRRTPGTQQFRSNFREWLPVPMISRTVDGLDISASLGTAVTELAVPFDINTIPNVPFTLDAKEMNDPAAARKKIDSAIDTISARINRDVANRILAEGGQTVTQAGALSTYNNVAAAESALIRQDVSQTTMKTMALNIGDYNTVAGDLAARQTLGNKSLSAYERSLVGDAAGFDTFRTSFMPNLTAAAGAATVTGAQSYVPVSSQTTSGGNTENVDNRFMDLTVSDTTNMKVGDRFTVAGVNEVSLINKQDTGNLRTFTVREVVDGTTLQISPAAVDVNGASQSEKEYGNVTAPFADTAPLTFINTSDAPINAFWENDSIAINSGNLAVEGMNNLSVMRDQTDSGIELVIASQGQLGAFTNQYRITAFYGVTVKDPMKCGVILANQ